MGRISLTREVRSNIGVSHLIYLCSFSFNDFISDKGKFKVPQRNLGQ